MLRHRQIQYVAACGLGLHFTAGEATVGSTLDCGIVSSTGTLLWTMLECRIVCFVNLSAYLLVPFLHFAFLLKLLLRLEITNNTLLFETKVFIDFIVVANHQTSRRFSTKRTICSRLLFFTNRPCSAVGSKIFLVLFKSSFIDTGNLQIHRNGIRRKFVQ